MRTQAICPARPCGPSSRDTVLNLARQSLYRFAALALADPRTGSWQILADPRSQALVAAAAKLVRGERSAAATVLAPGELLLDKLEPAPAFHRLPENADALNACYERAFGLVVSGACPPYETEYIDGKLAFQRSQTLGDVAGFYCAFGWEPSATHPERHDHVMLEMEFMASLLDLERRAGQSQAAQRGERVEVCHRAQRRFLQEHLAWWVPAFARLLSHEQAGGFYEAIATFLAALIPAERSLLDVPPPCGQAQPSTLERPEECEGCHLGPGAPGTA